MGEIIGIDASRNRSGGAVAHMIGILSASDPNLFGIKQIHLWAYPELMQKTPNFPWLIKHCPMVLEKSIIHQLLWQYFILPRDVKNNNCALMFNTDAGSVCPFKPSVTLSQDLLPFVPLEIKRYGFSARRLKLLLLKLIGYISLTKANTAIFLTQYTQKIIQNSTGNLNSTVISHGIDDKFRQNTSNGKWIVNQKKIIQCLYVSPVEPYKHQCQVVKALEKIRKTGANVSLLLVGGGTGPAQKKLERQLNITDPKNEFIKQLAFVKHDDIPKLLASSDIFIFASSCESMPITLLEAMAGGLPIACSNKGPMPEILEDGGVYFDPENSDSIADAITSIISDAPLRENIASRAKILSEQYSWKKCADETWTLLSNISKNS